MKKFRQGESQRLAVAQEQSAEAALSASPAPVAAAVLAAVMAAAAGEQNEAPTEGVGTAAAVCAGTPAAAVGADTQGHAQVANDRRGRGNGESAPAARGKGGKKFRAQPAPRRPGAGLGPGAPGPLMGWLLQGQLPQVPARQPPSQGEGPPPRPTEQADPQTAAPRPRRFQSTEAAPETAAPTLAEGTGTGTGAAAQGTRRSARIGAITWGLPRGGCTPWMPAGRGGIAAPGNNGGTVAANAVGTTRAQAGGTRGGFRGGRGRGRNPLGRTEIPARTGPWRERHDRPEPVATIAPANEERAVSDNAVSDPEFMGEEEAESEEISLDEEPVSGRNNRARTGGEGAAPTAQNGEEPGEAATEDTDVPSPSDLAETDEIWQVAGEWNVDILQRGEQPFLVRRLPPQILDRYCLCLLATLFRLRKFPACPGGWKILHFLPRLTLRPAQEPVTGSRWACIEARLHKFQRGDWADLFEEAGVIPATEGPRSLTVE
ncbi:unnamed protein product [Closterium sp. Naga37s-1]|nr:unnamed protein product [Closterium sp. Naga37s-1]